MSLYVFGRCPHCGIGLALDTSKPYRELGVWCQCDNISSLNEVLRIKP